MAMDCCLLNFKSQISTYLFLSNYWFTNIFRFLRGTNFKMLGYCWWDKTAQFSPSFYSHKFKKAGLRYELAVSLYGDIVSVNGPYAAGKFSDIRIFRDHLRKDLLPDERVIAD